MLRLIMWKKYLFFI